MRHTENHQDLSEAALVAADNAVNRSAEMLEIILRNPAVKWKADQTLSENIVTKTVNGVCQKREECAAMLSDNFFQEMFATMEDTAV